MSSDDLKQQQMQGSVKGKDANPSSIASTLNDIGGVYYNLKKNEKLQKQITEKIQIENRKTPNKSTVKNKTPL